MYAHVIAVDLETTGVEPSKDEILEIGAVVLREGEIVDRFSELVAVKRPPSLVIQKLTGIQPADLEGCRPVELVLPDLLRFIDREDALLLAHQAAFDRDFLQTASAGLFQQKMLDTVGLARILFPTLQSHSLGFLAEALALPRSRAHRALADCETTAALWLRLLEEARGLPAALVGEINFCLAPLRNHPFRDFFLRLEQKNFAKDFGQGKPALRDLFPSHKELFDSKPPERELDRDFHPLDPRTVEQVFSPGGALARALPAFESREGQVQMALEAAAAFGNSQHLMVEAPTGIGKSLAYLVPAALFAAQEGVPVVLSTNTKNLQSQLYEKDIPLVLAALNLPVKTAIIKGRGNYLCLRKLFYLLDATDRELTNDERIQMAVLLSWAVRSATGDIAECVLTGRPNFGALWSKLRTIGDECLGRQCKSSGRCFLRRARALSLAADLVVANHALVFAEMNMESAVLPEYRHIVFDEAHNLEQAATDHLTVELSLSRVAQVLGRLHRPGRRGGTGLAASVRAALDSAASSAPAELAEAAARQLEALAAACEAASKSLPPFFDALSGALPRRGGGDRVRFQEGSKRESVWTPVERAKEALVTQLAAAMRAAEGIAATLREMPPGALTYLREFQREFEAVVQWLREIVADLEFVLAASEANYVYWIETAAPKQGGARALAAPLSLAEILHDQVYARKASCLFCSATLSIRDRFTFLQRRLGIDRISSERLRTLQAPSPFDFETQCRVLAPTFLAEPDGAGSEKYIEGLAQLLAEVFRRSRGRAMALFTSYAMLQGCYRRLCALPLGDGVTLLAQGESGSREHITAAFVRDIHSVLLGTHSFWEGVDVAGETLSCLVIARLPFAVFTDPIVAARCEQVEAEGKDAFLHYSLPSAVIRFKQGFGRLIRSRTDRGVVIVADRRVAAKRYGRIFLESLPAPCEIHPDRQAFLGAVEEFFQEDPGGA